ncbi:MAG: hypothetical protein MO853_00935 [Candidatus Protistobacter heckmanni]|nr:hypothetical protein [Candidatus Protistobacter heckmanni]
MMAATPVAQNRMTATQAIHNSVRLFLGWTWGIPMIFSSGLSGVFENIRDRKKSRKKFAQGLPGKPIIASL